MKIAIVVPVLSLLFICIAGMSTASAGLPFSPHVYFTPPNAFTDETQLDPLVDLEKYVMRCDSGESFDVPNNVSDYEFVAGLFSAGEYTCRMYSVASVANGGFESEASNPVNFTVSQKAPKPIVDFRGQ